MDAWHLTYHSIGWGYPPTCFRRFAAFMGKDELAANLFRLTQTRAKIRNEKIRGQKALGNTADMVGKAVGKT